MIRDKCKMCFAFGNTCKGCDTSTCNFCPDTTCPGCDFIEQMREKRVAKSSIQIIGRKQIVEANRLF